MLSILPLLLANAGAAEVHWERLAQPPGGLRDGALGRELVARSPDGSLFRWDGAWVELADATPTSRDADLLVSGQDGSVWVVETGRGVGQRFDGGWSDRESLPLRDVTALVVEADGTTWASGLFGRAARRAGTGWEALVDLGEDHLLVLDDPTGGVWFLSDTDGGRALHRGVGVPRTVQTGLPIWSGSDRAVAVDGDGDVQVVPGWELAIGGGVQWVQGTEGFTRDGEKIPLSVERRGRLWADPDGRAAVVVDGEIYVSRPGVAPAWRDVADWSVRRFGHIDQAVVGDFDGDGWDDVFARRKDGQLVLLRQTPTGFVDVSGRASTPTTVALRGLAGTCDVDRDGRADLLVRTAEEGGRSHVLRSRAGWFERGPPLDVPYGLGGSFGIALCEDIDGDGDSDLIFTGSGTPDLERRLAILLNDGLGRFRPVSSDPQGLGHKAFVHQVHARDLDEDGDLDLLLGNYWGYGHSVLERRPDGFVDRSMGSGLDGLYDLPQHGWTVDLDGDGAVDWLIHGTEHARVLQGHGNFRFVDRTVDWGLGAAVADLEMVDLGDIDADGHLDLMRAQGGRWELFLGGSDGFRDLSASLPAGEAGPGVLIDLGADGDLDLLRLGDADGAWVNLTDVESSAASGGSRTVKGSPLGWRLVSARIADLAGLGLVLLGWLIAVRVARKSGSRGPVGGWVGASFCGFAALAVWIWALDRPPTVRLVLPSALTLALLAAARIEAVGHRRKTARRVGNYQLGPLLGRGGMGTVYLATDLDQGGQVALKLVHPELLSTDADLERYRREAQLGARIEDPHVVRILGFGEWNTLEGARARTTAYLVMEYVDGGTLRDLMRREGRLPPGAAAALVVQIAKGLAAVHRSGVVHRDVKPDNVALPRGGVLKLMDFGAAARFSATATASDVLGTLGYVAPEQARGLAPSPASDLYSLGVVFFELLTGHRPYQADDIATLLGKVLGSEPPPVGRDDVDPELEAWVQRLLSQDPEERPTAAEVVLGLEPWSEPVAWVIEPTQSSVQADGPPTTGSHAANLLRLLRLYYAYFRDGGQADLGEFALRLLTSPQDSTTDLPATRKRDE